jgi:type II secretory pathway component GspD/PulD (secretin)
MNLAKTFSIRVISACLLLTEILITSTGPGQGRSAHAQTIEPSISLSVKDTSLSHVLAQITNATGCEFEIDPKWQNLSVTVTIDQAPLSTALKRIIGNRNNAIIYLSNNRIKILLYESFSPGTASIFSPAMPTKSPLRASIPPLSTPQPDGRLATPSEPGVATQNVPVEMPPFPSNSASPMPPESVSPIGSDADGAIHGPTTDMGEKPPLIRRPIGSPLN